MLPVLITIDTEFWPRAIDLSRDDPEQLFERDILGRTPDGDFGVARQMDLLDAHGLRGVFFIEALHADAIGDHLLRRSIRLIRDRGHAVELHVHPEWLSASATPPPTMVRRLCDLPLQRQRELLTTASRALTQAGAAAPIAFRAGSYGADETTLAALVDAGLEIDSSANAALRGSHCRFHMPHPWISPRRIAGVLETPIACLRDGLGRLRPAQIAACSSAEMRTALLAAAEAGWPAFVIVTHSFELIRRDAHHGGACPDPITMRRFADLCAFLAANRDRFETLDFAQLHTRAIAVDREDAPVRTGPAEAAWRLWEQCRRRWIRPRPAGRTSTASRSAWAT